LNKEARGFGQRGRRKKVQGGKRSRRWLEEKSNASDTMLGPLRTLRTNPSVRSDSLWFSPTALHERDMPPCALSQVSAIMIHAIFTPQLDSRCNYIAVHCKMRRRVTRKAKRKKLTRGSQERILITHTHYRFITQIILDEWWVCVNVTTYSLHNWR